MLWEMLHIHQWDAGTAGGLNVGFNCWLKRFPPLLLLKKRSWISGKINKSDEGLDERCHTPGHMITALPQSFVTSPVAMRVCRRRLALLTRFYWHFGHGCQQGDISVLWFCVSDVEDHLMKSIITTCNNRSLHSSVDFYVEYILQMSVCWFRNQHYFLRICPVCCCEYKYQRYIMRISSRCIFLHALCRYPAESGCSCEC